MVRASICLIKAKNCFVNLPHKVARSLAGTSEGVTILRLSWESSRSGGSTDETLVAWAFVSWNGGLSQSNSGDIEVPLAFSRAIGLAAALDTDPYLSVRAEPAGYVPTAKRVFLEPLSSDDWEILAANADRLESEMLSQVCVAYTDQVLPLWVHDSSLIAMRVISVDAPGTAPTNKGRGAGSSSATCVRLTAETEVAVSPKPRTQRRTSEGSRKRIRFRSSALLRVAPPPPGWTQTMPTCTASSAGRPYVLVHPCTLRELDGWDSSHGRAPWLSEAVSAPPRAAGQLSESESTTDHISGGSTRPFEIPDVRGGSRVSSSSLEALAVLWSERRLATEQQPQSQLQGTHERALDGNGLSGTERNGSGSIVTSVGSLQGALGTTTRATGGKPAIGVGSASSTNVVILKEDRRIPLGHVAPTSASLRERLGLLLLRREARVRLLSEAEGPLTSPRLVFHRMIGATYLSPPRGVDNTSNAIDNANNGALRGSTSKTAETGSTDAFATQQLREALARAFGVGESPGTSAVAGNPSGVVTRHDDSGVQPGVQARARGHDVAENYLSPPVVLGQGAVVSLSVRDGSTRGAAGDLAVWEEGKGYSPDRMPDVGRCRRVVDFVVQFAELAPGLGSRRGPAAEPSHESDVRERGRETRDRVLYSVVASAADAEELISQALVGGEVLTATSGGSGIGDGPGKRGMGRPVEELGGVEDKMRAITNHMAPVLVRSISEARSRLGVGGPNGGVVVHGGAGAGKSCLALAAARRLREAYASLAWTEAVSCGELQGRKMVEVLGALEAAFSAASRHAPAVVVVDDLDKIAPAEGDDAGPFNGQAARIAERVEDLLLSVVAASTSSPVAVIATAASMASLHPRLTRPGFFTFEIEIPPPRPAVRAAMLKTLVRSLGEYRGNVAGVHPGRRITGDTEGAEREGDGEDDDDDDMDWDYLSSKTEGCQARDLSRLVKRALLQSALRRMKEAGSPVGGGDMARSSALAVGLPSDQGEEKKDARFTVASAAHERAGLRVQNLSAAAIPPPGGSLYSGFPVAVRGGARVVMRGGIEMQDLEAALEGFSAESLRGAGLFESGVEWSDVGGLKAARAELREMLELPVKYARLFEATPTRLPTGALLYGPPGCGKTLLAGAVAKGCGLNFISVKGPEVLDKYIGASEQAVRSLFARAASAAPCVLFFDEFEAVAPRRGNDNTGVTDRVVNQLLTFLDGVEGRAGVYVLGATSRPDLIDPALLRPGRLDRQLYCGFPDRDEREDILHAVSRKTPMSPEAREDALARVASSPHSEAFTGADLQALVDTAQLDAIHCYLEAREGSDESTGKSEADASGTGPSLMDAMLATAGDDACSGELVPRETPVAGGISAQDSSAGQGPPPTHRTRGVEVSADNISRALLSTRPSLSKADRARYDSVYRKFRGGSRPADFNPVSSVDDGTLRTALK